MFRFLFWIISKVIWEEPRSHDATPGGRPLITTAHYGSTVFARWRQRARQSSTRFLGPTLLTILNGSSIGSAVFARSMPRSLYTLHCTAPFPLKSCPFRRGWDLKYRSLGPDKAPPKRYLNPVCRFCGIHDSYTNRHARRGYMLYIPHSFT